ncbi:P12 [Hamiltonella phage APSE-1]|uniref:Putative protein p12 n=1 Tax=Acyrthosiphon pisum secondary endosymbiont phage 1 TaxID=2682836 RepID=VP12_BPAPS|nr:hypothetical protein APSE-1_12 [Hamiltonella phage APSE-1]Q9T1T6.1 RecName: Full=Putative protein p12 [Hamiltonella phage APSE-1]AAF03955.1 P12 [Hamiltonella phage APSE-1]
MRVAITEGPSPCTALIRFQPKSFITFYKHQTFFTDMHYNTFIAYRFFSSASCRCDLRPDNQSLHWLATNNPLSIPETAAVHVLPRQAWRTLMRPEENGKNLFGDIAPAAGPL